MIARWLADRSFEITRAAENTVLLVVGAMAALSAGMLYAEFLWP